MNNNFNDFAFEIKDISEDGVFAGYASVFDVVDNQQDIILKGAFANTLPSRLNQIKLLWQHKFDEIIGNFTSIVEDDYGLFVQGKLNLEIERAKEAYSLLKTGAISSLSIGYNVIDSRYDEEKDVREITNLNLWEISLVTFPANQQAEITYVKNNQPHQTIREFERFLKSSGYSNNKAKQIASVGFVNKVNLLELEGSIDNAIAKLC